MQTVNKQFAVFYGAVRILQIQRAGTNRFHFRTRQLNAGLVPILHEVVVVGFAVLRRDFDSFLLRGVHLISLENDTNIV